MTKLTLFIITFFLSATSGLGQDTIRVETSTYYTSDKEPTTFMNGDTLKTIFLNRKDGCISEPYYYVSALKFVITNEGRIVNIEQSIGNIDLDYCPGYVMDLMRYLLQSGQIKPAKIKGQNVNVQWTLKVEMNDKSGSILRE